MAEGHGGAREGAGRKPKDVELRELELLDSHCSDEDWAKIITAVKIKAIGGDMAAAKLLFERRFGKVVEIKSDGIGGFVLNVVTHSQANGGD